MTNRDKQELRQLCKEGKSFAEIRKFIDCADITIKRYMEVFSPDSGNQPIKNNLKEK